MTQPRFLMCRPQHFGVTYAINPWMDPRSWARDGHVLSATAHQEWSRLHHAFTELGALIELIPPAPGLPDLVFTANAAVVLDGKVLLSRFRHPERRLEEPHVERAFKALHAHGIVDAVRHLPDGLVLEGAGDCIWDRERELFWVGFCPRSHAESRRVVEETWNRDVVTLELADPRFYHLDTAFCPLPGGEIVYFPPAFTQSAQRAIHARVDPSQRIEIGAADACRLAANAVCIGTTIVMSACSPGLRARLEEHGYRIMVTPLGAFARSGGAAFCLTLRLDLRSGPADAMLSDAAVA